VKKLTTVEMKNESGDEIRVRMYQGKNSNDKTFAERKSNKVKER
jgi:hypothetical protein